MRRSSIEAQRPTEDGEYVEAPDDDEDGPDLLRVRIGAGLAQDFVRHAQALVEAGRPACPFCGEPLDPSRPLLLARHGERARQLGADGPSSIRHSASTGSPPPSSVTGALAGWA